MELIFAAIILLTLKKHAVGFSHTPVKAWKQVFLMIEMESAELFINGFMTGIKGSDFLYFPQEQYEILVEYKVDGNLVHSEWISLENEKTMVLTRISKAQLIRVV